MSMSDAEFSRRMVQIAEALDELLESDVGERMGFVLMCVRLRTEGAMVKYASNVCRDHASDMMKHLLKRWEENQPDVPLRHRH